MYRSSMISYVASYIEIRIATAVCAYDCIWTHISMYTYHYLLMMFPSLPELWQHLLLN